MPALTELTATQPGPITHSDHLPLPLPLPTDGPRVAVSPAPAPGSPLEGLEESEVLGSLAGESGVDPLADPRMSLLEQLERRQDQVLLELDQLDQRVLQLIEELGRYRSNP